MLYMQIRNRIKHRSLLVLYTNFESMTGLKGNWITCAVLPNTICLMVVFLKIPNCINFSGLMLRMEEVYIKTIAEKFEYEKRLIVKKELQSTGYWLF